MKEVFDKKSERINEISLDAQHLDDSVKVIASNLDSHKNGTLPDLLIQTNLVRQTLVHTTNAMRELHPFSFVLASLLTAVSHPASLPFLLSLILPPQTSPPAQPPAKRPAPNAAASPSKRIRTATPGPSAFTSADDPFDNPVDDGFDGMQDEFVDLSRLQPVRIEDTPARISPAPEGPAERTEKEVDDYYTKHRLSSTKKKVADVMLPSDFTDGWQKAYVEGMLKVIGENVTTESLDNSRDWRYKEFHFSGKTFGTHDVTPLRWYVYRATYRDLIKRRVEGEVLENAQDAEGKSRGRLCTKIYREKQGTA